MVIPSRGDKSSRFDPADVFSFEIEPYSSLHQQYPQSVGKEIEYIAASSRNEFLMNLIGKTVHHTDEDGKEENVLLQELFTGVEECQE